MYEQEGAVDRRVLFVLDPETRRWLQVGSEDASSVLGALGRSHATLETIRQRAAQCYPLLLLVDVHRSLPTRVKKQIPESVTHFQFKLGPKRGEKSVHFGKDVKSHDGVCSFTRLLESILAKCVTPFEPNWSSMERMVRHATSMLPAFPRLLRRQIEKCIVRLDDTSQPVCSTPVVDWCTARVNAGPEHRSRLMQLRALCKTMETRMEPPSPTT
jgi:hypothetical protein